MLKTLIWCTVCGNYRYTHDDIEVTYISLKHRTDRQALIEAELDQMGVPYTRTTALAVSPSILMVPIKRPGKRKEILGTIGCALSHARALEASNKSTLVLEDDATFRYIPNLRRLLQQDWWDVIAFAFNGRFNPQQCRVVHGTQYCRSPGFLTTSAYFVRDEYKSGLIGAFRTSAKRLIMGEKPKYAAPDVAWQSLAKKDRWYVAVPQIARQRPSYSDIQFKKVDYGV